MSRTAHRLRPQGMTRTDGEVTEGARPAAGARTRADSPAGPKEWLGLAVLAAAALMTAIDTSVVLLALPSIARELHADAVQQLWIVDGYGFVFAGLLIAFGGLADHLGRRRMAMLGATVFGLASLSAAFALSPEMLIAARAVMGIGAAALAPSLYGLLTGLFPESGQRAVAIGVFMTCLMGGMIIGPVVGGIALSLWWWGAVFLIAVPVMALVLVAFPLLVADVSTAHPHGTGRGVDAVSVPLSLLAVLPIVFGIKEAARSGDAVLAIASVIIGVVFLVVFLRRQRALSHGAGHAPLLDLAMFRRRGVCVVLLAMLLMTMLTGPLMMLDTQYFQAVAGADPLAAGLLTVPPALTGAAGFLTMPLLAKRIRPGLLIAAGLALSAAGLVLMAQITPGTGPWPLVVGFSVVSLGTSALPTLGTNAILGSVPAEQASSAASTQEASGQFGYALGIAVVGSLTTAVYRFLVAGAPGLDAADRRAVSAGIDAALGVADPAARAVAGAAFTSSLQVAALVAAIAMLALAGVTAARLRHIPAFGAQNDVEN